MVLQKFNFCLDEQELAAVMAALDIMVEAYQGGFTEASVNLYSAMQKMTDAYRAQDDSAEG